jgi:hypothetical protein
MALYHRWLHPGRIGSFLLWLAIVTAYLYPQFLFNIHNPNERVRIYMTAAIVEEQTFAIGRRTMTGENSSVDGGLIYDRWGYVNDKALVCDDPSLVPPNCDGLLYSAKAPGSSFLGIPFYAVIKGVGELLGRKLGMNLILIYLRLFLVIIPTLVMLVLFRRYARTHGTDPVLADLLTLGMAVGSMVYTYSHMVAGHQIATYCLFFSFLAAWKATSNDGNKWPLWSGFWGGMAVFVEYPMALVSLIIFAYFIGNLKSIKRLGAFVAGGSIPAVFTAWFHFAAFGSPLATPYSHLENPQFIEDIAPGFMGLREPRLLNLQDAFVAPYEGLFFFAPWMALMVGALILYPALSYRFDTSKLRKLFWCHSGAVLALTLFIVCHSLWRGGWTLGPRYIVPIVPFGAMLVLHGFHRVSLRFPSITRFVFTVGVLAAVFITAASSLVSQGFDLMFYNPLQEVVLPMLSDGYITINLGNLVGLTGLSSIIPMIILMLPVILLLIWRIAENGAVEKRIFVSCLVVLCLVGGIRSLTLITEPVNANRVKAIFWTRNNFYPFREYANDLDQQLQFEELAGKLFSHHGGIQTTLLNNYTSQAMCTESLRRYTSYQQAETRRIAHQAFIALMPAALPFPIVSPIPISYRPDYWIPSHELNSLAKELFESEN